jgi:predicted hydrocarbon binding protein
MTENLVPFERSEVGEVLAEVSGGLENDVRRSLTDILDKGLRDFLFGLVNMPRLAHLGAPHLMLRVRTFQTILDDFRGALGDQYNPILNRIGRTIGFNFAISLLRVLRHSQRLPMKYDALLEFWAKFDSAAQMGEYTLVFREEEHDLSSHVDVIIKDLFLTLGYEEDEPLRHCPFITGYFEGALDTTLFLWTRWIKQSPFKDPKVLWSVAKCDNIVREDQGVIRFKVDVAEERWPELKDHLASAVEFSEKGNWTESIIAARVALERGLVHCAGEEPKLKVSFGRLLEQLQKVRLPLTAERWRSTYAQCSETAHQVKVLNEVTVTNILFNVWLCLQEAESIVLSQEQGTAIKQNRAKYVIP